MQLARRGRVAGPLAVFGLWMLGGGACAQTPLRVHYPAAESTTDARDRAFRRVPVAIDRGMFGWRVLLVRRMDPSRVAQARDLHALARLRGAQGHDDYVPRSVLEVGMEVERRGMQDLQVAPGMVLHYPASLFFYVRRDDRGLGHALTQGLQGAIRDGRLQRLFDVTYGRDLAALDLPARATLSLPNPTWSGDPDGVRW